MRDPDVCIGDLAPRRRLCVRYRHGPEYGEAAGAAITAGGRGDPSRRRGRGGPSWAAPAGDQRAGGVARSVAV